MAEQPRVLYVTDRYAPNNRGGAEYITQVEAEAWAEKAPTAVFACHGDGARPEWGSRVRGGVVAYRSVALPTGVGAVAPAVYARTLLNREATRELKRCVASFRPDVIHAHHISTLSYGAVASLAVPKVLTFHDYHVSCVRGGLYRQQTGICEKPCLSCRPYKALVSPALRRFQKIIAISSFMEEQLEMAGLGALTERLPNAVPSSVLPQPIRTDGDLALRVLVLGRLEVNKAIGDFADRFAERCAPGQTLTVAGTGRESERLTALAARSSHVDFLGAVPKDEVVSLMAEHDVVVVPSRWHEVLNTVVKESQAAGRPVVATDVGGNRDMVQHGVNGFLVPLAAGDVAWDGIFAHLDQLATEPALRRRMADAAAAVADRVDVEGHMDRLAEIYARARADWSGIV